MGMTRLPASLLSLLLILGTGLSAGADEKPEADPAARAAAKRELAEQEARFATEVNAAIERGAAWLKATQLKGGNYPAFSDPKVPNVFNIMDVGVNALVVLTLSHCGLPAKDDAIDKCFKFCKFHYAGGNGSWNLKGTNKLSIYTAATLILALDAAYRGVPKMKPIKKDRYGNLKPPKPAKCQYPTWVRKWIQELVAFIVKNQHPSGGWRYPGNIMASLEGDTDLSNVQYALLGLEAAANCGIQAPVETWRKAAEHVLALQEEDGLETAVQIPNPAWEPGLEKVPRFIEVGTAKARGWTYLPREQALGTSSMTCAGVTCLALLKERLWLMEKLEAPLRKRLDRGILDGLAWLSDVFTVEANVDGGGVAQMWHYYYLYGLERTGAKTGVRYIGTHDWYQEGARHLLAAQTPEGGWKEADGQVRPADATESATTQTCFALLFLKRTTRPPLVPMTPPVLTGD
jgi:hypothetical protein